MAEGEGLRPRRGLGNPTHRNIKLVRLQIGGERGPAGVDEAHLQPERAPEIAGHVHVIALQFAGGIAKRQRRVIARHAHLQFTAVLDGLHIARLGAAGHYRQRQRQPHRQSHFAILKVIVFHARVTGRISHSIRSASQGIHPIFKHRDIQPDGAVADRKSGDKTQPHPVNDPSSAGHSLT